MCLLMQLQQTLLRSFLEALDKYNIDLPVTKAVDELQKQFQCCGAEYYTDWLNTTFGSLSPSVPTSCCKLDVKSCVTDISKEGANINQQGCVPKLKGWVEEHIIIFGGIGLFIGLTQVFVHGQDGYDPDENGRNKPSVLPIKVIKTDLVTLLD
ncbi:UNVERIFIED_CONTAM: hypothetical protein K2H54_021359 [Gekko kuhli]